MNKHFCCPEFVSAGFSSFPRPASFHSSVRTLAAERQAAEQAEYEAKRAKREAAKAEGKSPRGPEPKPPESGVGDTDQINLTDEESRAHHAGRRKQFSASLEHTSGRGYGEHVDRDGVRHEARQ